MNKLIEENEGRDREGKEYYKKRHKRIKEEGGDGITMRKNGMRIDINKREIKKNLFSQK